MDNKANKEREQLWQERVAQLKASGLSQRSYAMKHGLSEHQVSYWVRRITSPQAGPAMMPVHAAPSLVPMLASISLRSECGWTLTLPSDVPASWLAELLVAL